MVLLKLTSVLPALFFATVSAIPLEERTVSKTKSPRATVQLPFNKIVAFGDDFTDDGSGSYAHGITGNVKTGEGKHMWGHNTFTDGLVSVTYLSQQLKIPISYNYAWGSSGGADTIGSICDNAAVPKNKQGGHAKYNGALVPSALNQVTNYTKTGVFTNDIANTLHFFWTGNNDMIASLGWAGRFTLCTLDTLCVPGQQRFIAKLVTCFETGLNNLVKAGAQHILVPNVYPRQLSPWTSEWITKLLAMVLNFGSVVDTFNTQLQASIDKINAAQGTNIMYYDVNAFMQTTLNNPSMVEGAAYTDTCVDGCSIQNPTGTSNWNLYWNHTIVHHQPDLFYWMTEVMPSTTVLKYIAKDMTKFINAQYAT